jgi:hypothetical protein
LNASFAPVVVTETDPRCQNATHVQNLVAALLQEKLQDKVLMIVFVQRKITCLGAAMIARLALKEWCAQLEVTKVISARV